MINTSKAQNELNNIKNSVIGIFKYHSGVFELIIKENTDSFDTIHITSFGAIQTSQSLPKHYGKGILFPKGKNMNEVLNSPFDWAEFIKTNFY